MTSGSASGLALLDAALRGGLLALLLLTGWRLLRDHFDAPAARAGAWLMAGLVVQVIVSLPAIEGARPAAGLAPLIGLSVGNSVLFWVFARSLFDDDFVLQRRHVAAWLAVVGLGTLFYAVVVMPQQRELAPFALAVAIAMRWVPVLFALLAVAAVASQWRADLVERRRRLRLFIVVAGSVYTVVTAAARLISADGRLSDPMASLDIAMLLVIAAVSAAALLRASGTPELLAPRPTDPAASASPPPPVPAPAVAAPDAAEERLAAELQRLMSQERAYRGEDLTVAGLASRLGTPEYRLRRLINQRLGHRNFNAYVNAFRLDETRLALADPAQREVPVLTIALDAGFGSIGPFNRAFKAATGLTPTEFRRQKLADS